MHSNSIQSTTGAISRNRHLRDLLDVLDEGESFAGLADSSEDTQHGFAENASFITLALSHLRDGMFFGLPMVIIDQDHADLTFSV